MIDWNILLRLLTIHIVCDFMLQTDRMVERKNGKEKSAKIKVLLSHSLIHAVAVYVIVWRWECWYILPAMFVSHLCIDWWKSSTRSNLRNFLIDQLLHLLVISLLWLFITGQWCVFSQYVESLLSNTRLWMIVAAYLLMLKPSSIVISLFIKGWTPDVKDGEPNRKQNMIPTVKDRQSLKDAGRWIGYLERCMTLTFILTGNFAAVGFVLAAKSIFRIGDLRQNRDFKLTEYILIGTFASFFIAIVTGLVMRGGW